MGYFTKKEGDDIVAIVKALSKRYDLEWIGHRQAGLIRLTAHWKGFEINLRHYFYEEGNSMGLHMKKRVQYDAKTGSSKLIYELHIKDMRIRWGRKTVVEVHEITDDSRFYVPVAKLFVSAHELSTFLDDSNVRFSRGESISGFRGLLENN